MQAMTNNGMSVAEFCRKADALIAETQRINRTYKGRVTTATMQATTPAPRPLSDAAEKPKYPPAMVIRNSPGVKVCPRPGTTM